MKQLHLLRDAGLLIISVSLLSACSQPKKNAKSKAEESHGFNFANLDTAVSPAQDFYEYANGGWLKAHPVPPTKSSYSSFNELLDHNNNILKNILLKVSSEETQPGSIEQKVGDFYISGMDTNRIDKEGIKPFLPVKVMIDKINDHASLLKTAAELRTQGLGSMYGFFVNQDDKEATKEVAYLSQGGLGLPDRDYYLRNDKRSVQIRQEYEKHLTKMFELLGDKPSMASEKAKTVMSIEKDLAEHSMTRVERRDPDKVYHKMTIAQLDKLAPEINWKSQLSDMGITDVNEVVVRQPEFVENLSDMLIKYSISDWKAYLMWHAINADASYMSKPFEEEEFNFYGKALQGQKEMEPRWKRVLRTINRQIGFALGQLYVKKAFPPEAKTKALEMISDIKNAFKDRIETTSWMSEATKKKALQKLNDFVAKIGYPDKWIDYSPVHINKDSYLMNVEEARKFNFHRMISKLGKPVDRSEWYMTPPTVNAYYNPNMNEIVFPAGILQPPFFDPNADAALNFGGMGAVIGHEMTHGFDDQGSKYDGQGNLDNWWTKQDRENFEKHANEMVKEYSKFAVLDSLHINGKLTLGENIADNGGLTLAYAALQKYYKQHGKPGKIQGLTPNQRFFIAWARIWRANTRPEALENRLRIDPHSPGRFRTIGVVTNMPQFYKAFDVQPGDSMYIPADQRASVW